MELQTFTFGGRAPVRVMDRQGEPWWVAKDVCVALGITSPRSATARLDSDDVGQTDVIDAKGRPQPTTIVSEAGLYALVLRSDKPEAKAFKRWITHEVLPAIRRTGAYQALPGLEPSQGFRKTAKALGLAPRTLHSRTERFPELLPFIRRGDLEAIRRHFQDHPIQTSKAWRERSAARAIPEVLRVDASGVYTAQALVQLLAELRQVYGAEGAQEVLHRLDPKTFPAPKVPR